MLKALTRPQIAKLQRAAIHTGNVRARLDLLRAAMAKAPENIDAYVVTSEDAHQSEYTAECDNRRAWISGFTGSAGCAVVTQDTASLFTDGRYFLQASKQLSDQWQLMKQGVPGVPSWQDYLVQHMKPGSRIGIDPEVITAGAAADLEKKLESIGAKLVPISDSLVDAIRADDRPARPSKDVTTHSFAGQSRASKIKQVQDFLASGNYDGTVFTALDEIAWLLNLRGSDIHCCPVFFAFCIVTLDKTILYTNNRLPAEILDEQSVEVREYDRIKHDLQNKFRGQRFVIDKNLTNLSIVKALGENNMISYAPSPITLAKAIKNETELKGLRACHERDAVALCKHFAWLSRTLNKSTKIREYDAVLHLEDMRKQQSMYVGMSFDTVAASGPNGAIIHYQPTAEVSDVIDPQQIYLCDSGAHYLDGTTDVTRTYLFAGQADEFQKRAFTRVLQAHIALDTAVFPTGTTGYQLDPIARRPLWQDGLDYRHGTGHGVGAYLNVHEGPHGIGSRPQYQQVFLQPGMVVTNEPGYYQDGKFGIRIENVLVVRKADTSYRFGDLDYLGFEHITFVPMGNKLLDPTIMTEDERKWINKYHEECRKRLEPLLRNDPDALSWVAQETEKL